MNKFYKTITEWLLPLGYIEVYTINHPTDEHCEFHFIKDTVRVVCVKTFDYEYCHLHADILVPPFLSIKTGHVELCSQKLDEMHVWVLQNKSILIKAHKKTIWKKIKQMITF